MSSANLASGRLARFATKARDTSADCCWFTGGALGGTLLVLALLLIAPGAGAAEPARRSDPKGLVTYVLPSGWDNERTHNGRHFTRVGLPDDPNFLGVIPRHRDDYSTLENVRRDRNNVYAAQGMQQRSSKVREINDFQVWEVIHDAQIRGQAVVFHDMMMFSDDLVIEVHLNVSAPVYESYLPDLYAVVASMQATE